MKLKFIVTNESDLPEDETLKGLYEKVGDKWVMNIEGAAPKQQLDEFRENNLDLKKKLEAYGDMTPEQAAELKQKESDWKAGNAKTKEEIERQVEERTAAMKTAHEKELEAERKEKERLKGDLESHVIDGELIKAGTELGLRSTAHADLTYRGRQQFKLDEHGKPVATDKDGKILYNQAGDPLSPKDYVSKLTKEAPHLFDPNSGSGAGGSGNAGAGGNQTAGNPWKKDTFNLTEQSRLFKENPDQARQMAAQAGVRL